MNGYQWLELGGVGVLVLAIIALLAGVRRTTGRGHSVFVIALVTIGVLSVAGGLVWDLVGDVNVSVNITRT